MSTASTAEQVEALRGRLALQLELLGLEGVSAALLRSLFLPFPNSFSIQLVLLSVVFASAGLLVVFSLAIRWRRSPSTFWVFRRTAHGFITPHWNVSVSIACFFFCCTIQGMIYTIYRAIHAQEVVGSLWQLIPWTFAWISGFLATWNLGVLYLLELYLEGKDPSSHFLTSPRFINTLAISTGTLFIVTIVTCIAVTQEPVRNLHDLADWIKQTLLDARAEQVPDLANLANALAPVMQKLPEAAAGHRNVWSIVMWNFAAWNMLLLIGLDGIAGFKFYALRRAARAPWGQKTSLPKTYGNLFTIVISFSLIMLVFLFSCLFRILYPEIRTEGWAAMLVVLVPMYAAASLGLFLAVILVLQALATPYKLATRLKAEGEAGLIPVELEGMEGRKKEEEEVDESDPNWATGW